MPFPHALDQDQAANAAVLAASGAAQVVPQSEFTPERLASLLRKALQQHYGIRSEKLVEFGVKTFRGRLRAKKVETPTPAPVPAPSTPSTPSTAPGTSTPGAHPAAASESGSAK